MSPFFPRPRPRWFSFPSAPSARASAVFDSNAATSWLWTFLRSVVSFSIVAVRVATVARSEAVAVARLEMFVSGFLNCHVRVAIALIGSVVSILGPVVVAICEEGFKVRPCFGVSGPCTPVLEILIEDTGLVHEVIRCRDDLFG